MDESCAVFWKNCELVQDTHCIPQLRDPLEIQGCRECKKISEYPHAALSY